ncbi:AAA family ATPase [Streptomyces sp. NPDC019645]|uniref:ATP-binding protein n=1 Tax=Streptomyces sp. NPDC019645 TaxID=3154786 RepID=UPI0034045CC7
MLGGVETRSLSPVFVGRTGELTALGQALSRATAGEPQALLIAGEAGVGKTRLVEEFHGEACRAGAPPRRTGRIGGRPQTPRLRRATEASGTGHGALGGGPRHRPLRAEADRLRRRVSALRL